MLTDRSRRDIVSRSALACSTLAMAVALTSAPVRAQSFLAGSTTTFGSAVVTTGTNTTTITISSPSAVIDWTPTDTATSPLAITYQPNGTTATFTSASPFTVLNRIVPVDPTRGIAFDGIVNSLVNGSPGGTVFFYSPGGIFLSPNAQFNVGNLGLTSAAPVVDATGNWYNGNQVQFQAANPNTFVNTLAGAQINAPAAGSYVAIVAPRIDQRAAITVNGQAALVSADAATITFNPSGLFDIQVNSGTSATGTTLFNSGSITGPASTGAGVNQRIYAVAVPKNTAITLAISAGSTLGFNIAGAADVVGNAVVLSAGGDIAAGNTTGGSAGAGSGAADISIANSSITSSLRGQAKTNAFAFSQSGGTSNFASSVDLRAATAAKLSSDGTGSVTNVAGNVTLTSTNVGIPGSTVPGVGGTAEIFAANAGSVSVTGNATLQAVGFGISTTTPGLRGGSGTGGVAIVQGLTGGDVSIGGNADINAFGVGGAGGSGGGLGGDGIGGRAQIFARDSGSSVSVTGTANVTAGGNGGAGNGAVGGIGTGGQALINAQAAAGAAISIGGAATIYTIGTGGSSTGASGGLGTGGASTAAASAGNTVQFGGALDIFAIGNGGPSTGGAAGSSQGGSARLTLFSGGTITVAGNAQVFAPGLAGQGNGAAATATGGLAEVTSQQSSSLSVTGFLNALSAGSGIGDPATGNIGQGAGVAGTTLVAAFTGGSINVGSVLRARAAANATGNRNATGGTVDVQAFSGGSIAANELNIQVNAIGGTDTGSGSGSGTGGTGRLTIDGVGSIITIANGNTTGVGAMGDLDFITAQGIGGQNNGGGSGIGGAGVGGTAAINVTNGGTFSGPTTVGTQGFIRLVPRATGGAANTGATAGGSATGGTLNIFVDNGTFTSADLLPSPFAQGGNALTTATGVINGGNAIGGQRNITVRNGGTMTTSFSGGGPGAQGGNASVSGRGGDATGGTATLTVDNATLNLTGRGLVFSQNQAGSGGISGNVTAGTASAFIANGGTLSVPDNNLFVSDFLVASNAFGAADPASPGSAQGTVTAGTASLTLQGGTITGQGSIVVTAEANANSDQYAQGGVYQGGQASVFLRGGSISNPLVAISATANAASVGVGLTGTGGTAIGGTAQIRTPTGTTSLTNVTIEARGIGGDVFGTGAGGDGTGGSALLVANGGAVQISGTTTLDGGALGGDGAGGGAGGKATAGGAIINSINNVNTPSAITLGTVTITGDATGGLGGAGSSGGGAGGAGGAAFGGNVQALGGAGNGTLVTGNVTASALATGGIGGAGGTGATGGAGGTGGKGLGGFIQIGTASFLDNSPTNTGSGTFGTVSEDASAFGGNGGAGGSGTTSGVGGRGGDASDGASIVLVRGSPVTFNGSVSLIANATGGNGGAGSTAGAGGDATVGSDPVNLQSGGVGVTVTERFQHPEQPGSLSAGIITGRANAIGGSGSTFGASLLADQPLGVNISRSTATIGTLDLSADANTPLIGAIPSMLTMIGSTASISNLSLDTIGTLSVALDTSTLNTDTLTLLADNFVLPTVKPAVLGTINVSSGLNIGSSLDFLAYANFNVGFAGSFALDGSVLTGDLNFDGLLDITAAGSITTGNITAGDVDFVAGTSINSLAVTADGSIDLTAIGSITTGQLTAGDTVEANAGGALNVAGATAGIVNPSTDPLAEYNVGLRSLTSVVAGNVSARASFGVSSPGSIAVGNVSVGQVFLALPGTSLTTGSISTAIQPTSQVYIGNFSMEALGGQVASNFDPAPILALAPVATSGPITINGPVSTVTIRAATLQSLSALGTIQTPAVTVLVAGTTINAADIVVGDRAIIAAGGNITLGNVNAGITLPSPGPNGLRKIAIGSSSGTVTTGNLSAGFDLGIQAGGGISTGTLLGRQILLLAGSNVSTGAISAVAGTQPVGQLFIGNFSMANQTSNVFQTFQSPTTGQLPIFNLDPVRTGGSITFGGNIVAGNVQAAAAQGISLQAVTTPALSAQTGSGGVIDLDSGGTVTVNGRLAAGNRIDIASRDIDITQTGSLDALGSTGEVQLASNNPNGAFIGDGLTTTNGYSLSNAEYGRLKAGEIAIIGDDMANLATDLTIGSLTINATQLYGANGVALFASGNRDTQTPSGILRIAGAVVGNGFTPTTEIDLLSGTVELEAANGSLKVNAGSDTQSTSPSLGGLIFVEADHIHIASDAILTKLRADPFYTGHIDELNAPATVQRTDGVFNALGFEVVVGETFYIQNTGSRVVPAGFLATFDATDVMASDKLSTVKGELVLNGQFQTSTGTVSGKAAFDQVIADMKSDPGNTFDFSDTSTLNGCAFLSGVCAFGGNTQMAPPASEISVIIAPVLAASPPPPAVEDAGPGDSSASSSDSEAAADDADSSDDEKKDDGDGDEAASPIAPPTPLISTRALDSDVNVVEPVSGAGNPALFGSAVDETTVQGGKP